MGKQLVRPKKGRIVGGVAKGIANYLGLPVLLVRIIWIFLILPGGLPGLLPYLVLWIIIPSEKVLGQESQNSVWYNTVSMNNLISQHELHLLIDLGLSVAAGFIIGAERESRGKDAGISTHIMVITGAMLFTFLSSVVDPASKSRIAAQIVSGIGFLGAGLILKDGANVRNLTTAASIWVAGAIGMAFGFNFHIVGIMVTIAVALIPRIPHINTLSPEAKETKENSVKRRTKK